MLLKLDAAGGVLWQKMYGQPDAVGINSVEPTSDGGFIAVGTFSSFSGYANHLWVLKVDQSGDQSWQMGYGGSTYDSPSSMQVTLDGGFVVAGVTNSFGEGPSDSWVLKLNPAGEIPGCSLRSDPIVFTLSAALPVRSTNAMVAQQNVGGPSVATVTETHAITREQCYQPQLQIAVSTHGTGSGSVVCQPNPVDLGYPSTCTAVPSVGSTFIGATTSCSGDLGGTNPFTVGPVTTDCSVGAEFSLNQYSISVSVNNHSWGSATCTPNPAGHGSTVECRAVPNPGYVLKSFDGCGGATDGRTYTFVATQDCTVRVTLEPAPEPIPFLGLWGLGITMGLVAGAGALALRRAIL